MKKAARINLAYFEISFHIQGSLRMPSRYIYKACAQFHDPNLLLFPFSSYSILCSEAFYRNCLEMLCPTSIWTHFKTVEYKAQKLSKSFILKG